MKRCVLAVTCSLSFCAPASAMVGGAEEAPAAVARHVVMLVNSRGGSCTGVAISRSVVLTAAHCLAPEAEHKLVEFGAGPPSLRDVASISAPSAIRRASCGAASRHRRCGADQDDRSSLFRHCRGAARHPRQSGGRGRSIPGRGLRTRGARRWQERRQGAQRQADGLEQARHIADPAGRSGTTQASGRASAPAPGTPARRCSTKLTDSSRCLAW